MATAILAQQRPKLVVFLQRRYRIAGRIHQPPGQETMERYAHPVHVGYILLTSPFPGCPRLSHASNAFPASLGGSSRTFRGIGSHPGWSCRGLASSSLANGLIGLGGVADGLLWGFAESSNRSRRIALRYR
jgi:hypothetical protein